MPIPCFNSSKGLVTLSKGTINLSSRNQAKMNHADNFESEWVCSMGHLLGLFDKDWLGIPSTGQPITMRYSDFWHIESGKLAENWVMVDNLGVIQQLADRDAEPRPPDRKQIYMTPANPISAQQNIGVFCSS